jgi:hypothetical protein
MIPYFYTNDPVLKIFFGATITLEGFFLTTYLSIRHLRRIKVEKEFSFSSKLSRPTRITYIFGMVYLFVAAFALTEAIETYGEKRLPQILSDNSMEDDDITAILVVIAFLVTAIAFFHAGITFLATDASEYLTRGKPLLLLPNFVVLFFEAVIIFFMAANVDNILNFLKLTIALLMTDIIWILFYIRHKDVVFVEWLHYNSLTVLFLILVLPFADLSLTFIFMFIILTSRTVCDYIFGWKRLYFKHPVLEM